MAERIVPAANALIASAMALQNSVLRACVLSDPSYVTNADIAGLAASAATIKTMAFGSPFGITIVDRLLTEASDTVRSRSALDGIVRGRVSPPLTMADLERLDRALLGLPALTVLLRRGEQAGSDIESLCRMAVLISAKILESALVYRTTWQNEALRDSHWTSRPPELADRLRLRDVIQAGITTIDKLNLDVARFAAQRTQNNDLPFASDELMTEFIAATIRALQGQVDWLTSLAAPGIRGEEAREVLVEIDSSLVTAREAVVEVGDIDLSPFDRLRRLYYRDLPDSFGFASEAFVTPIGAFANE